MGSQQGPENVKLGKSHGETILLFVFLCNLLLYSVYVHSSILIQGEWCLCLSHSAPPLLVSALCKLSEGSRQYIQVINTQHCYDIKSFVCS